MVRQPRVNSEAKTDDREAREALASSEGKEWAVDVSAAQPKGGSDDWSFTDWAAI